MDEMEDGLTVGCLDEWVDGGMDREMERQILGWIIG